MVERDDITVVPTASHEHEMALKLIEQRNPEEQQKPYGIYFLEPPDPAIELAKEIELAEFNRVFGNGPDVMEREYNRYNQASKFILMLDHEKGVPAGVIRIIVNSPAGLKSLNDLEKEPWNASIEQVLNDSGLGELDLESTWDIATIAVASEYQGLRSTMRVSSSLLHSALSLARNRGISHYVSIIDDDVLRLRFDRLTSPPPFDRLAGLQPGPYLDSLSSTPVYADLAEMERRAMQTSPNTHSLYFEGSGLKDVSFPQEITATQ